MKILYFVFSLFFLFNLQADSLPQPVSPPSSLAEWEEHKAFFRKHGYLWIKGFFSEADRDQLITLAESFHDSGQNLLLLAHAGRSIDELIKDPNNLVVVAESNNPLQVCRTEDMLSCFPALNKMISSTITPYLYSLLEERYVLFKDKLNFKWPNGGAFSPHQDFPAFSFTGINHFITAMVAIDPATEANGYLQIAKNWKKSLQDDPSIDKASLEQGTAILPYVEGGKSHGSIKPEYTDKMTWLGLATSPGDLVIFDSFVPHYSEANKSKKARRAIFFTYNKLVDGEHRTAYYKKKRNDPNNPMFHFGTPTKREL